MNNLPNDPIMLMSYINTKLRDEYDSLNELCDSLDIDIKWLTEKLNNSGFEYNPETNKFW